MCCHKRSQSPWQRQPLLSVGVVRTTVYMDSVSAFGGDDAGVSTVALWEFEEYGVTTSEDVAARDCVAVLVSPPVASAKLTRRRVLST